MKPYYEKDGITLYHGDCREILPKLGKVDLVLTDPPYGLNWQGGTWGADPKYRDAAQWDVLVDPVLLAAVIAAGELAIVWGGNHYSLPPCRGLLAWQKTNAVPTMADFELAWTTFDRPAKAWIGSNNCNKGNSHPTQKPVPLMQWCIEQARRDLRVVLDPFAGSGSTLVAAKLCGLEAIGIEIEERYCALAAERLSQKVIQWD